MNTPNPDHPIRNTLKHLASAHRAFATAALAALAFANPAAQAETINVDLGNGAAYTGLGVAPDLGTTWNIFTSAPFTSAPLVDSNNNASGVTLSMTAASPYNAGAVGALLTDYFFNVSSTTTVDLSGLTPGASFSLYLYGNGDNTTQSSTFTVAAANGGAVGSTNGSDRSNINLTFVQLDGTADSNGDIQFSWTAKAGTSIFGPFNGFQLVTPDTPPVVLSSTPPDGGTTAAESDLVLTFNKAISIGTGDITIKNLTDSTDTVITLPDPQVTVSGTVLTINPTADLLLGKNYAVQIVAGAIKSFAANLPFAGIPDGTTWNFATAEPTATNTVVVSSGSPTTYGGSVTFTATVAPVPSGGTVQFYNGFDFLGSPVAVNTTTGLATVTTTTLGATTHGITAEYSGNFQFAASTSDSISQVVNKALLTVTADNKVRGVGLANPSLTAQFSGFVNGETLVTSGVTGTPALSTTADLASPAGTYPITCGVGTLLAANYDFTTAPGTLTVVPVSNLLAYEGFQYTAGDLLAGQSGGSGFSGAWNLESGLAYSVEGSGLAFSDLAVAGGRTSVTPNAGFGASSRIARPLTTAPTTQTFGSYLLRRETLGDNFNVAGVQFGAANIDDNSHPAQFYGKEFASTVGARDNLNQGVTTSGSVLNMNETYLVLFSFDIQNGSQTLDLWVLTAAQFDHFKAGGLTPAELSSATVGTSNTDVWAKSSDTGTQATAGNLSHVKFMAFFGGSVVSFDELRLSQTSLNDVVPLQVGTSFTTWANANGATGQTPGQDHDNDGVENGVEYFMGETGSTFTAMPSLNASNEITWPASAAYQGTYEVQTSPDLATWTNVDPKPTPSGGTLTYTLLPGAPSGKSFVRLLVTPTTP